MKQTNLFELDQQIRALGIPLDGISMGKRDDKTTWRLDFKESATDEQRKQAQELLSTFELKDIN